MKTSIGEEVEKLEPLCTCTVGKMENGIVTVETVQRFLKN